MLNTIPALLLFILPSANAGKTVEKQEEGLKQISLLNFRTASSFYKRKMNLAKADSPEWQRSTFLYAVSLLRRLPDREDDKLDAGELLDDLISRGPKGICYAGALFFRGKLAEQIDYYGDKPDFASAYKYYNRVVTECPKSLYASYAAFCRAQVKVFTMDANQAKEAVTQLINWLNKHPDNPYAVAEWYLISDTARYPLKDYKLSLRALLEISKKGIPQCILPDDFYWQTANTAVEAGNNKVATEYFTKIINLDVSRFKTISRDMLKKIKQEGK